MFLKKLYKEWKPAFYVVAVFCVAQVFFMYKAVETVPFFLYNMYSTPQPSKDSTTRLLITVNGKPFDPRNLSGREQETLTGSFDYFERLRKNHFYATDTNSIRKRFKAILPDSWYATAFNRLTNHEVNDSIFLAWWARYLAEVTGKAVDSFTVVRTTVAWHPLPVMLHDTVSMYHYEKSH